MIGVLTLVAFGIGNKCYGLDVARTMAFVSLGLLELIHSFNIKSEQSIFKTGLFENKYLIWSFVLGVIVQTIVVWIPVLADMFKVVPLTQHQWFITIGISLLPILIVELQKKFDSMNIVKVIYFRKQERKIESSL